MDETRATEEINKYKKFRKVDGATYRRVNQFLRKRTYITAREWALARLCTDFRTTNGAEMTFIGQHLPELVPFMEEPYSPQAVNQARHSFKKKVRKSSATFFYGAMCGFFTTEELDDLLFEASEVARFLLEVESTTLDIDEEIDIEDRIAGVMRSVGEAAKTILNTRVMADGGGSGNTAVAAGNTAIYSASAARRAGKGARQGRKKTAHKGAGTQVEEIPLGGSPANGAIAPEISCDDYGQGSVPAAIKEQPHAPEPAPPVLLPRENSLPVRQDYRQPRQDRGYTDIEPEEKTAGMDNP